jgi:hypothetical protein
MCELTPIPNSQFRIPNLALNSGPMSHFNSHVKSQIRPGSFAI